MVEFERFWVGLDTNWALGRFTIAKRHPTFGHGYHGTLGLQSRFRKQWFDAPKYGLSGWALIFRAFDHSGTSDRPDEFFVGIVPPEQEAAADQWIDFLNAEIRRVVAEAAARRPPP